MRHPLISPVNVDYRAHYTQISSDHLTDLLVILITTHWLWNAVLEGIEQGVNTLYT